MTMAEAEDYLHTLQAAGMKLGLARMERVSGLCGHPEQHLRFVHVAGTNGKGSVSRMIQSMLTAGGYRTGLYSSPAVTGVRDTISVDNQPVSKADFARLVGVLRSFQPKMGASGTLSEFELTTMLAFLYFLEQRVDACVVECGLGGKDDATNCIPAPLAAVLTPVALDHTAVLGDTVEKIARIKCGILKSPCSVITSPAQAEDALAVLFECAAEKGLTVRIPSRSNVNIKEESLGFTKFRYNGMDFCLPLTGKHQVDNALTALETVDALETKGLMISKLDKEKGIASVQMPCRQEVVSTNPLWMADGAHNPQGITALAQTLRRYKITGITLLTGMLADKDMESCIRILSPYCRTVYCCTPDNPRAMDHRQLAALWKKSAPWCEVYAAGSPNSAWNQCYSRWIEVKANERAPVLAAGSFYVASFIRPLMKEAANRENGC